MPVRTVYKLKFKLRVVNKLCRMEDLKRLKELESPQQTVADVFNISQSLVSKWGAKERQLEEALKKRGAARKRVSCIVQPRRGKYPLLEKQLYTDIRTKRAKGLRVTTKWIRIHMKKLISKQHGNDAAKDWKLTLSWRFKFCRRWGISLRRKTKSAKPLFDRPPKIKRWHAGLVKGLARGKQLCPIFGRWPLSHRYDVDQVPCYFRNTDPVTLHCQENGPRVRWPPKSGTDVKRDCSQQLCCRFIPKGGLQPKAGIRVSLLRVFDTAGYGRIRQDTAGYGRIRQDTAGYGRIRQDKAGYGRESRIRQDTAGYGRIRQDTANTAGYGRIRQDTAGYDRVQNICLFALRKQPFCVHSAFGGISYCSCMPIVTFPADNPLHVNQIFVSKNKKIATCFLSLVVFHPVPACPLCRFCLG